MYSTSEKGVLKWNMCVQVRRVSSSEKDESSKKMYLSENKIVFK